MDSIKKLTNRILIIVSGLLIIVIILIFFLIRNDNPKRGFVCGTKTPIFFCGNSSSNLSEKAIKGKNLFNSNCAACHKLHVNMTGPALSKIDSTILWNWLTERNQKADSTKFSEMKIDYHKIMWNNSLNENQLTELYEFTKSEK